MLMTAGNSHNHNRPPIPNWFPQSHDHSPFIPLHVSRTNIYNLLCVIFFLAYFPQKKRQRIWIQFPFPLSLRSVYVNLSITHYLSSPSSDSPKPNPQFHSANWICTLKGLQVISRISADCLLLRCFIALGFNFRFCWLLNCLILLSAELKGTRWFKLLNVLLISDLKIA